MIRVGWDCDGPTPEPSWLEAVQRLAPRTDSGHDWLMLRWEPGDWWDPVERWVIWQMTPPSRTPRDTMMWLNGRSPRDFNYYDGVLQKFVNTRYPGTISFQQWQVWREHKAWGRPLWVVQGGGGGHKRYLNEAEQALMEMQGLPTDLPPGLLPYSTPDNRTWSKLRDMDVVIKYGDLLRLLGNPDRRALLDQRQMDTVREVAQQLSAWYTSTIESALDLTYTQASALNDFATSDQPPLDGEQVEADFVDSLVRAYT